MVVWFGGLYFWHAVHRRLFIDYQNLFNVYARG